MSEKSVISEQKDVQKSVIRLAEQLCGDRTVPLAVVLAALTPYFGTKDDTVTAMIADIWEKINDHIDCSKEDK